MKREIVCFACVLLALSPAASVFAADAQIPSTGSTIAIDGLKEAAWLVAAPHPIANVVAGSASKTGCSGAWRALWDARYLYVFIDVNDDRLTANPNPTGNLAGTYQFDSVEVFTNTGDRTVTTYSATTPAAQYRFGWQAAPTEPSLGSDHANVLTGISYKLVTGSGGYSFEIQIPWANLYLSGVTPAPAIGMVMGFEIQINDNDGGTTRTNQLDWFTNANNTWSNPSTMGTVELVFGSAPTNAIRPNPANGATDVPLDALLSWTPGMYAGTHNVYLGTSFADVNAAQTTASPLCVSRGQDANAYDPAHLDLGVTYYWRVDEVNATPDQKVYSGEVWSFTTEPIGYPIDVNNITATASSTYAGSSPRYTIDKSGLTGDVHGVVSATMWSSEKKPAKPVWLRYDFDKAYKLYQMLVWNSNTENELELNYGLQDVTIEYSSDGTDFVKLGDFVFNQGTGLADYRYNTTIDFGGVIAKAVKLIATSNYGGSKYGLSELRFLYIPVWARQPKPDVNSTGVDPRGLNLTWRSGREAASHDVYLGTDPTALTLTAAVTTNVAPLATLNLGTKYYWRVDEVNSAATPKSWTGAVWYFTTPDFLPVDDFEAYNDKEGTAVFDVWKDGYGKSDNGGQIGYDVPGPYMEKTIRHGGAQSTPFYYKNAGTPGVPGKNFSEASWTFDAARDWTIAKADTLRIWVRGRTADLPTGSLPAATTACDITSAGTDIWQATDQFRFVYRQLTGDGSITAKVESQTPTHTAAKAGVMIRVGLDAGALETHMVTMPGASNTTNTPKQVEWNFRPTVGDATGRTVSTTPTTPSTWVRLTRKGDAITGEYSADGVTWVSTGLTTSPQTIAMGNPVNIGLVVCSHVAGTLGEAKFSNVKVTGNVTGEWQKADVGITAQPAGNTADTFYVALEDDAGKAKTVVPALANPVCTTSDWQAVDVPFSQFTGVTMTKVKKLTFGVGDASGVAPQHGAGLLYIDDIGIGHPAAK